ncbi:MAG: sugar phosphate isomerase/epimerase family protein [Thermoproteota archaeon]
MKVGLYSVTYSGAWYRGGALQLDEFIKRARTMGFDGVEIGAKRPHANPLDLDKDARRRLRELIRSEGLELPTISAYTDFTSPVEELRENQMVMLREQIRLAKDLGARYVRVFLAWPGVTMRDGLATYDMTHRYSEVNYPDVTRLEKWNFAKACLKEAVKYAQEDGIVLALQNHAPLIRNYMDVLDMVREVGSEYLKVCLDAPLLTRQDDEWVEKAVKDVGNLQVHSHYGGEFVRGSDGKPRLLPSEFGKHLVNYPRFVKALDEIGYRGYLCYEFCHPCLDDKHQPAGIERIDEQVKMALEYMRDLLSKL